MQEVIQQVFNDCRRNFIWTPDGVQFGGNHWTSHADEIDGVWRDDCDGFACTAAELLIRRGVEPEKVSLIVCQLPAGRHAVCGVMEVENDPYILDNIQRGVWFHSQLFSYELVSGANMADKVWRSLQ